MNLIKALAIFNKTTNDIIKSGPLDHHMDELVIKSHYEDCRNFAERFNDTATPENCHMLLANIVDEYSSPVLCTLDYFLDQYVNYCEDAEEHTTEELTK